MKNSHDSLSSNYAHGQPATELTLAERVRHLEEVISKAQSNMLETTELQALWRERESALKDFLEGQISDAQLNEINLRLENRSPAVRLQSPEDFYLALTLVGVNEDQAQHLTKHESEHFDEAKKHGLLPEFVIEFSYDLKPSEKPDYAKKSISMHPKVAINWPENMSSEQIKDAIAKGLRAPEHLSPGDIDLTEKF